MSFEENARELRDRLLRAGLFVESGVPGVFGTNHAFEQIVSGFSTYLSRVAKDDGAESVHFPPVLNRDALRRTGYMENFPHLCGSVHSFAGTEADQADLVNTVNKGDDWSPHLRQTQVALCPSACYPLYPTLSGQLPSGGRLFDLESYVFRHEPSDDPARMQIFRMRENIRIGPPDEVLEWRSRWLERGLNIARALGLDASQDLANDPFFGRGGKMMGRTQKAQELKFELLAPVASDQRLTAIASFNYHQDHYGRTFEIAHAGQPAHSGCMGFGLERVALALLAKHGLDPLNWPTGVRNELWP